MSFATSIRRSLEAARSIGGQLGLRTHAVVLQVGTWSEGTVGDGSETAAETTIKEGGQNPQVHWLTDAQIALSEDATEGTCRIGPLTPNHTAGGVALSTLAGTALSDHQTFHVEITGPKHPNGRRYKVRRIEADSTLHYHLVCDPA